MSMTDEVYAWLKDHPGEWTARQIAEGLYDPPDYKLVQKSFNVYNSCKTLENWGYITSRDYYVGKRHVVKWSADEWLFPVI